MKYIILVAAIFIASCSPVKRVLKDDNMTKEVASEYLRRFPFKDSIVYLPGKEKVIIKDTTISDTAYLDRPVPYQITNTRTIETRVTDTSAIYSRAEQRALQSIIRYQDSLMNVYKAEIGILKKDIRDQRLIIFAMGLSIITVIILSIIKRFR